MGAPEMQSEFKKKWDELFGPMWDKIMELSPELGGFMLDKKNRIVWLDKNSMKLAEVEKVPNYDAMIEYLSILSKEGGNFAKLAPLKCYEDDNYIAGIIRWFYDFSGAEEKDSVPLYDRGQIEARMNAEPDKGVLALIDFTMSERKIPIKDVQIFGVIAAINESVEQKVMLAANYPLCYWIYLPDYDGDAEELIRMFKTKVEKSGHGADLTGREKRYVTFNAGIGLSHGKAAERMESAQYALYEANTEGRSDGDGVIKLYSGERSAEFKEKFEKMGKFFKLLRENLFLYHFQPIVSATDGEIIAYEMLMRSPPEIGMFPLDILECAEQSGRLYDIEKATISNALEIISKNQEKFMKKKLFVNAITAHMLNDEDWNAINETYGELMEKMVIEFTEQSEISEEEVHKFRSRLASAKIRIAIDDFGTGYSNTANLIKYAPDIVKIDRSLITGIHTKPLIKKFVAGAIEFIHENGFQALAEGVETSEELKTMIELGSDLIQGYYTARPRPIFLENISEDIEKEIRNTNISVNTINYYHPNDGEKVDLKEIATGDDKYKGIFLDEDIRSVAIVGDSKVTYELVIRIKSKNLELTFENVNIRSDSDKDEPVILLHENTNVTLCSMGENKVDGKGILVPSSSSLTVVGPKPPAMDKENFEKAASGADNGAQGKENTLEITSNNAFAYGIGCPEDNSYGDITVNIGSDKLIIVSNGDKSVGIGGGRNENSKPIEIKSGNIEIMTSGTSSVGIGTFSGNSIVDIDLSVVKVESNAPNSVGIGANSGDISVQIKQSTLDMMINGIKSAGIGVLNPGGNDTVQLLNCVVDAKMKSRYGVLIGTFGGKNTDIVLKNDTVKFYSEGGSITGIGDKTGDGRLTIESCHLDFDMRTGDGLGYGFIDGCDGVKNRVQFNREDIKINA